MRKLGKIKLNQLSKDELDQRKMNALKGGCECSPVCGCFCNGGGMFPDFQGARDARSNPTTTSVGYLY